MDLTGTEFLDDTRVLQIMSTRLICALTKTGAVQAQSERCTKRQTPFEGWIVSNRRNSSPQFLLQNAN
jgi:hypothetical protein